MVRLVGFESINSKVRSVVLFQFLLISWLILLKLGQNRDKVNDRMEVVAGGDGRWGTRRREWGYLKALKFS